MREWKYSDDYNNPILAELYDLEENFSDDVMLVQELISGKEELNILECFCGTGRLAIPLAEAGHKVTGIDIAQAMVERAREKVGKLSSEIQQRVNFIVDDVFDVDWGQGYDLILFTCNAFYELPSAELQERCIALAAKSLKPGGYLYVDNNDYKGNWSHIPFGQEHITFDGTVADGTHLKCTRIDESFDEVTKVLRMQRVYYMRTPDSQERVFRLQGKKRPVTAMEITGWLEKNHFEIVGIYGDRQGNPYSKDSDRAIFWSHLR